MCGDDAEIESEDRMDDVFSGIAAGQHNPFTSFISISWNTTIFCMLLVLVILLYWKRGPFTVNIKQIQSLLSFLKIGLRSTYTALLDLGESVFYIERLLDLYI